MGKTFAEVRKNAPQIHVAKLDGGGYVCKKITPIASDAQYDDHPFSGGRTKGNGTLQNPFACQGSAPVSPHYTAVDLWCWFRDLAANGNPNIIIRVNDWLLNVEPDGVRAVDGIFTKLG